jgi:hypothetical protein
MSCWTIFKDQKYNIIDLMYGETFYSRHTAQITKYVNWSACISYPHSRACPLIGSFLLVFTYWDHRERKSDGNIIFRCSFVFYFFLGFHVVTTGNLFLCLTMMQKSKNIKTLGNLINTRGLRLLVQIR